MYLFGLVRFGIGRKIEKYFFFAFSVSELKKDLVIHYILPCKYYSANIKYKKYNKYVLFSSYITSYIELKIIQDLGAISIQSMKTIAYSGAFFLPFSRKRKR